MTQSGLSQVVPGGRRLPLVSVASLLAIALLGACGSATESGASDQRGPVAYSAETMDTDQVLYAAGAVVRAEVVDVRGPMWNSPDGKAWTIEEFPESYANPFQYREVDLRIADILRDDIGLNDVVTIVAKGSGDTSFGPYEEVGGRFVVGDDVVVALTSAFFMMREGPVDRLYAMGGAAGVFDVKDGTAYRQVPGVDLSLAEIAALEAEARLAIHPDWDRLRFPPDAEQQLKNIEEAGARIRAENERILNDPNNICNFVGDRDRAEEWLKVNPGRQDVTLDRMLDPTYIEVLCDGFEEKGAEE